MSIPDFQSFMLPLLRFAEDNDEHATREAAESLAQVFQLSDADKEELLPSGQNTIFGNRVYWGITHLKHAKLLESTRRGFFRITQRGIQVLQQNPSRIDHKFLKEFAEYRQFITPRRDKTTSEETAESIVETITSQTPEELLEGSYQSIRQELAQELLSQVKKASPIFFEALVVD